MANRVNIGPQGSKLDWNNWGKPMTDAVNDFENRIGVLEGQRILAYGERTTNGTTTTTVAQGYLRIDGIPIISGQAYRIWSSPFIFESTVAADLINAPIWVNVAGAATTGSTQITALVQDSKTGSGNQRTACLNALYPSGTTGSLSILLGYARTSGTGNVRINAQLSFPCQLAIEAMGANPTNTGISI